METMVKFDIEEDTVTPYFEKLIELSSSETNKKTFLKDAGHELHFRYVEPKMPKWNPNLLYSPLEKRHQFFDVDEERSSLELLYTGFTETAKMRALPEGVWSEFGDKAQGILKRDYAYYQETGEDPIAPEFPGHRYVGEGTANYATEFHYKTMAYLDRLMHLEKWQRQSQFVDLYDYME